MTALKAASTRLEAYVLSFASPHLVVGDDVSVGQQCERDRHSGYPKEVLRQLLTEVIIAARSFEDAPF